MDLNQEIPDHHVPPAELRALLCLDAIYAGDDITPTASLVEKAHKIRIPIPGFLPDYQEEPTEHTEAIQELADGVVIDLFSRSRR